MKHGFYDNKRETGTLLMLCVSEFNLFEITGIFDNGRICK